MANHRDLASALYESLRTSSASRIWRTVVFAGAMLAAPLTAGADTPPPQQKTPAEKPADKPKTDDKAADKDKPKADDKGTKKDDKTAKKPAKKPKPRPRGTDEGGGGAGRGFILS
jgi:hypothetical protein